MENLLLYALLRLQVTYFKKLERLEVLLNIFEFSRVWETLETWLV